MTNDQTVTQALEPCPLCQSPEVEFGGYGRGVYCIICKDCCIQTKFYPSRDAAATAWNTRTAHSGEGRSNDDVLRCDECGCPNPVWFAPSDVWNLVVGGPEATDDPGGVLCPICFIAKAEAAGVKPNGWRIEPEGRSNGAGEEAVGRAVEAMTAWTSGEADIQGRVWVIEKGKRVASFAESDEAYEDAKRRNAVAVIAALSAPQGEVEREGAEGRSLADDLRYLEEADAHADEGPLGEPAARSILKIALRLARNASSVESQIASGCPRAIRVHAPLRFCPDCPEGDACELTAQQGGR